MTKSEIIETAFKVWGRNYYRKTSLSQLAGELKVSKPALYRHFASKQVLTASMTESFLDEFSSYISADFKHAQSAKDADEGIFSIIKSIAGFFAENPYSLIFSLMSIYDRDLNGNVIIEKLKIRGADIALLNTLINKKYHDSAVLARLTIATLTFQVSFFHMSHNTLVNPLSSDDVGKLTVLINKTINVGLGYTLDHCALDFEKLETQVNTELPDLQPEPFFKAVAEAVAEAGPWDVSMDMVAKKLGLSKSSLYVHFKNKKDMLRRLFVTEFKRIIAFARRGINFSGSAAEQLYLGIFSVSVYLRLRPEILVAMDWIRTRKLDIGKTDKHIEIFRLFEDVNIELLKCRGAEKCETEKQMTSHWILFLLINILTCPDDVFTGACADSNSIRILYKFILMGLGGFIK